MKKIVLGIMIILLAGVLVAQSSFATSLISIGDKNATSEENNTVVEANNNINTTVNNDVSTVNNTPVIGSNVSTNNNINNNNLGNSYIYNNLSNDTSLPKTGLDNTVLIVLTAVALVMIIFTFKKMSDYGNI